MMFDLGIDEDDRDSHLRGKKRARDRKAQRNLRQRQDSYIQRLEDIVAFCQEHHRDLASQHRSVGVVNTSVASQFLAAASEQPSQRASRARSESLGFCTFQLHLDKQYKRSSSTNPAIASLNGRRNLDLRECDSQQREPPVALSSPHRHEQAKAPLWDLLPLNYQDSSLSRSWCPWMSCPDVVSSLPDLPSPHDLLHGSTTNAIANAIHISLSTLPYQTLEKFAVGYLIYVHTKWMLQPSEERFLRMPAFLRPTQLQLKRRHHAMYDGLVWPQLRDNLIESLFDDDLGPVFHLFSKCLRCSWPQTTPFLSTDEPQQVTMEPAFLQTISSIQGWYLLPDFAVRYPDLLRQR